MSQTCSVCKKFKQPCVHKANYILKKEMKKTTEDFLNFFLQKLFQINKFKASRVTVLHKTILFFSISSQGLQSLKVQFTHLQNPYHKNVEYFVIKKSGLRTGQDSHFTLTFLVHLFLQSRYQMLVVPYGPAVSYLYSNLKHCICMVRLARSTHSVLFCPKLHPSWNFSHSRLHSGKPAGSDQN